MRIGSLFMSCLALGAQPAQVVGLPYLAKVPVIDGGLDPGLERLPALALQPQAGAGTGAVEVRAAYGSRFLYLHVRSQQAGLQCRDRAYQNGDGLIVVLATPQAEGAPSRRFRVTGFSPQAEGQRNWQHAFTWYRDLDLVMAPLEGAQFKWLVQPGQVEFELLLPWQSLPPYHPWLRPGIGLNICYVRARGDGGTEHFLLTPDDRIQSEQSPRRYLPLRPEAPVGGAAPAWFARLARGHPEQGGTLQLEVAGLAPAAGDQTFAVRVLAGEGETVQHRRQEVPLGIGLAVRTLELPAALLPGGYAVEVHGPVEPPLRWGLSVLPEGGTTPLAAQLARQAGRLAPGTRSTLAFRVEEIQRGLASLQATDPASGPRQALQALAADLAAVADGRDPVATATGLLRLAYRSALDGSLQPYSLRVPGSIPPGERRPMLVFLHGSGQDDRGTLDLPRAPAGWFQLAPRGRGTSNCFSADGAQEDLRETIADVCANHPVDPSRIVLAGFSMGGYGVYRTAFQRPGFFRALAVFSGVPDVATRWLGPGHPDFLDPATHTVFKDARMFIFHGTADRNCPFEKTAELVAGLRRAGARLEFVTEDGKGHEAPSDPTQARYIAWLEQVTRD